MQNQTQIKSLFLYKPLINKLSIIQLNYYYFINSIHLLYSILTVKYFAHMKLTHILGAAAFILGVYIIFFHIFTKDTPFIPFNPQLYHMGCYDDTEQLLEYQKLAKTINKLKERNQVIIFKKAQQSETSVQTTEKFQKASLAVAYKFQQYLKEIYQDDRRGKEVKDYYQEQKKAYNAYIDCRSQLKEKFLIVNEIQCRKTWQDYKKCPGNHYSLKLELNNALKQRAIIISQLYNNNLENQKQYKPIQRPKLELMCNYENLAAQKNKIQNLNLNIEARIQFLNKQKSQYQQQLERIKKTTNSCQNSQQIQLKCLEMAQTIQKKFGYISLQQLNQNIQSKRQLLGKLKKYSMTKQSKKDYQVISSEFQMLVNLKIQLNVINTKCCEAKMIDIQKSTARNHQQQIKKIKYQLTIKLQERQKAQRNMQILLLRIKECQQKVYNYSMNNQQRRIDQLGYQRIKGYEQNLKKYMKMEKLQNFEELDEKCANYLIYLTSVIKNVNQISQCISIRNYYESITKKRERYQHIQETPERKKKMFDLKNALLELEV